MVKYEYNPDLEVFRRTDNRGVSLKVNIIEARRIKSMMDLGIKAPTIMKKIDFVNKISMTSLRTIMSNIESGNLELDGDYPAPTESLLDLTNEEKITALEKRVNTLEDRMDCLKGDCFISAFAGPSSQPRKMSWRERLGL